MTVAFYSDRLFTRHDMGPTHPESPKRLAAIEKQLKEDGLWDRLQHSAAAPAADYDLVRGHHQDYLQQLHEVSPVEGSVMLDADTQMNPHSLAAANLASGTVLDAVSRACDDTQPRAFCAVRPPGHHAESHRAMGFCLLNHVALGAIWAKEQGGLERVAVVDFDVHHGNGSEEMLAGREGIALFSSFQHPLYPGTGVPPSADNIFNYPLDAGCDSACLQRLWQQQLLPQLQEFAPQLILVSAGFDAHRLDPLAGLCWEDEDFAWLGEQLMQVARQHAQGRLVASLEGGYHLEALGRSVSAFIGALMDQGS